MKRFLLLAVLFSASAGVQNLEAGDNVSPVALSGREDGSISVIETKSYRSVLLQNTHSFSADLMTASSSAPLFDKGFFVLRGGKWERLLDQSVLWKPPFSVSEGKDGVVEEKLSGKNGMASFSSETTYSPDSISFKYRVDVFSEIPKCQRITLELEPTWQAFAGSEIAVEFADGSKKTVTAPKEKIQDGKYNTFISGVARLVTVKNLYGCPGAGLRISGDFFFNFEITGQHFKMQVGAPRIPGADLKKGDVLEFDFKMTFDQPAAVAESESREVAVAVDAAGTGPRINPDVFGAQLGIVGYGIKREGMRNEWQNNPKHDPDFRDLLQKSGVSFLRIMLWHLYEAYAPGDDPICPSETSKCDYSKADVLLEGLAELNIGLQPVLGGYCPPWLSTKRESPNHKGLWITHRAPPKDMAKLAEIFGGMVSHFNVEKKFNVRMWEFGNEPDDWTRYWIRGTMQEYIELFKLSTKAMKEADPSISISAPALSNLYEKAWPDNKLEWKDEFMENCRGEFNDFSFHCYGEWDIGRYVKDARKAMEEHGAGGNTITLSEYNISAGDGDCSSLFNFTGALYVSGILKSIIDNSVDRAVFFSMNGSLGLIGDDAGKPCPRPSYHSFRMHASLGQFKSGTVLPSSSGDQRISSLSCLHEDGKGYSIILSADAPFVREYSAALSFSGAAGKYSLRKYLLNDDGKGISEIPEEAVNLSSALKTVFPGRSICLLVLRKLD